MTLHRSAAYAPDYLPQRASLPRSPFLAPFVIPLRSAHVRLFLTIYSLPHSSITLAQTFPTGFCPYRTPFLPNAQQIRDTRRAIPDLLYPLSYWRRRGTYRGADPFKTRCMKSITRREFSSGCSTKVTCPQAGMTFISAIPFGIASTMRCEKDTGVRMSFSP